MAYQDSKVYLYEVGLHATVPRSINVESDQRHNLSQYLSPTRTRATIACLQATRDFLDRMLSLPSHDLLSFTMYDFIHLIYTVLVLGCFSVIYNSPFIDATGLPLEANFRCYIVKLMGMTEPLITISEGEERVDYVWHIRRLFQASKVWIDQLSSGLPSHVLDESHLCYQELLPAIQIDKSTDLSVCLTEVGICTTLFDPPNSIDPSLVMFGSWN